MNNIIVMFPGQGSQYVGMGKSWFEKYTVVKEYFKKASDILGYSLEEKCFKGPLSDLTQTDVAQVAVFTTSIAMYTVLQNEKSLPVDYMTGHSLGEITALTAAGAMSFEDAVKLVKVRGEAMASCSKEKKTGMIAVLEVTSDKADELVADFNTQGYQVQVANYNSERQTVVAGETSELKAATKFMEAHGAKVVQMNVSGAFHSSYMQSAVEPYTKTLNEIAITLPKIPVISSVTGQVYKSVEEIREVLSRQLTRPVVWNKVVSGCARKEVALWLEVGPKDVLKKLVQRMIDNGESITFEEDYEKAYQTIDFIMNLKKKDPNVVDLCMGQAVATRNRNFNEEEYETGVVKNYKKLVELKGKIENSQMRAEEAAQDAIDLLKEIFRCKMVPEEEQKVRIQNIIEKTKSKVMV